jgi:replicative DNA helicase
MSNAETLSFSTDKLRIPPHSIHAEQSILGSLMLDNAAWNRIADQINSRDFYRKEHRLIFQAISQLAENNQPLDIITLSELLERRNELDAAGGMDYLLSIGRETPTAANVAAYAKIVRETSILRQLVSVGTDIADSAYQTEGRAVADLLDTAERKVFAIAEHISRGGDFHNVDTLIHKALERIENLAAHNNPVTGLATGFTDLDTMTAGLQPSDLIIIAGRPSMGKTALALAIAAHVATLEQKSVAIFSMEMPGDALAVRLLAALGRVNQQHLRTAQLSDEEWINLTAAISSLSKMPLFIDDTPALTPTELRTRARRFKREHSDLGLIVIDYLQLMQTPREGESRAAEIATISRSIKALAKELNVPIIALSQLNRSLEQRTNKRPIMSDLRESGSLEQDADLIIFIYRDEVYREDSANKGIAEIIIGKQRNGPIGIVRLTFLHQFTKFENYTESNYNNDSYD